jgi:hypothetical protein
MPRARPTRRSPRILLTCGGTIVQRPRWSMNCRTGASAASAGARSDQDDKRSSTSPERIQASLAHHHRLLVPEGRSERVRICQRQNLNIARPGQRRGRERKKAPLRRAFRMRSSGLEPPRAVKPTRPSTLRVYQFRHERRVREYSLATAAGIGPLLAGSSSPRRRAATQRCLQRRSPQLASVHSRRYSANTCSFQRHHPAKLGVQQTWI